MEILDELAQLGDRELALEIEHFTVHPRQFFGLELNPRAAAIAELVLWIGYLQWQARAAGSAAIGEPVLEKLDNIQCRDAVLAYDGEPQAGHATRPGSEITVWDRPQHKEGRDRAGGAGRNQARAAAHLRQPAPRRMAASRLHRRQSAVPRKHADARTTWGRLR